MPESPVCSKVTQVMISLEPTIANLSDCFSFYLPLDLQMSNLSNGVPSTREKEPRACGYATLQHYTLPGPGKQFSKRFRAKPKNAGTLLLRNTNFQIGITYRTIIVRQRSDSNIHRDWGIAVLVCISCNLLRANCPGHKSITANLFQPISKI